MRHRLSAAKPGYTLSRRQLWFSFWLAWLTIGAIVACGLMGAPSAVELAPIVIPSMIMLIAAMLGIHRFAGAMDYRSSIVPGPDLAPDDARADRQGEIQ
ncbi:NAD(P)+ transhydrogenase beta chain [Sinorhizobium meliloti]|nr:NAD(P)+ transhydrogenase beta chain [Sinorhizobium meliloti]